MSQQYTQQTNPKNCGHQERTLVKDPRTKCDCGQYNTEPLQQKHEKKYNKNKNNGYKRTANSQIEQQ